MTGRVYSFPMRATALPERNLDLLRATAVLCVLIAHVLKVWSVDTNPINNWDLGRIGVLLFFVHTSLVLMSSLERQGPRPDWVRAFYIRRAFRIYPLAIVTVLITAALGITPRALPFGDPHLIIHPHLRTVLADMALVQNITRDPPVPSMLWTLPIEVQLYLMLPLAFLLARKSVWAVIPALAACGGFALLVTQGFTDSVPGLWRLESVVVFAPCFVAGVLAYAILRRRWQPPLPGWSFALLLLGCVAVFKLSHASEELPARGWPFCITVALAITLVRDVSESWLTRVAHGICTVSYGIYLLHFAAIWLAFVVLKDVPMAVQWVMFFVFIIGLPATAYRAIERPGIVIGRRMVHVRAPIAAEVAAP